MLNVCLTCLLSKEHIIDNIVILNKRLIEWRCSLSSRAPFFIPFEEKYKTINMPGELKEDWDPVALFIESCIQTLCKDKVILILLSGVF